MDLDRGSKFWLLLQDYAEQTKKVLRGSKRWLTIQWFEGHWIEIQNLQGPRKNGESSMLTTNSWLAAH